MLFGIFRILAKDKQNLTRQQEISRPEVADNNISKHINTYITISLVQMSSGFSPADINGLYIL